MCVFSSQKKDLSPLYLFFNIWIEEGHTQREKAYKKKQGAEWGDMTWLNEYEEFTEGEKDWQMVWHDVPNMNIDDKFKTRLLSVCYT